MGEMVALADYDGRVLDWEAGLPSADELPPLSLALVPPLLAAAFNIRPEPIRTTGDVDRASRETIAGIRGGAVPAFAENSFKPFDEMSGGGETAIDEEGDERSDSRKIRRIEAAEEADSASRGEYSNSIDDQSAKALKRPRLVWTPQLHRRFVDVVSHLGIRNAVPKTIMQLMNVEGLTRENVASHLQKYRLYLKRSNDGPNSSSDQLFASVQAPQSSSLHDGARSGHLAVPVPMPYGSAMVPVPMFGNGHGHMGMSIGGSHGMDHHQAYGVMHQRVRSGNSNGSVVSYPHGAPMAK